MSRLRRIVLLRHGDTVGESSIRFHGSGDVALSDEGRQQVKDAALGLRTEVFDTLVASPLRRSWESAWIVSGGAQIRLESGFREIHFGRWEGMTAEEIRACDPVLYEDWQAGATAFEYPSGEPRADFKKRVVLGLERLEASGARHVLAVLHKGVIGSIVTHLVGAPLPDDVPELGQAVSVSRRPDGTWYLGRRSSNPDGL